MIMSKASVLFAAAVLALPGIASVVDASESPGRIGVYARLYEEAKSPEKLTQAMKRIKATGIDFILPAGKGSVVYWDSSIAPKELVKDRDYMGRIVRTAHAEGLKVYPVSCVCTEGGESGPNALLKSKAS